MSYEPFEVRVIATTDKAALVEFIDFDEQRWVPFSQIEDNSEDLQRDYEGEIYITEWFAKKEGLI